MQSRLKNPNITRVRSDGSLTIHFGKRDYHALKILPWDEGCQILVRRDSGWEYFEGVADFVLVNTVYDVFSDSAISIFGQCVPLNIKLKLSKFRYHQARILQLISSNNSAYDLFENNPILLWVLIDWAYSNEISLAYVGDILCKKQIEILSIFFFDAEKKHLKLLKVLSLPIFDKQHISIIFEMLSFLKSFPQLSHCKIINVNTFEIFKKLDVSSDGNHNKIIAILKYYQRGGKNNIHDILTTYNDCLRMHADLYLDGSVPTFICRNYLLDDMYKYHDKLIVEYNARAELIEFKNKYPNGIEFPKPYLLGNENIIHISNYIELNTEGREMRHCVSSYGNEIMKGYSCIYKVLFPQRATLELVCDGGKFRVNQFKLKYNHCPSRSSYKYIRDWLKGRLNYIHK